jgi:hypothetical protein
MYKSLVTTSSRRIAANIGMQAGESCAPHIRVPSVATWERLPPRENALDLIGNTRLLALESVYQGQDESSRRLSFYSPAVA